MESLDARGQACPLPVVRAKKALASMTEGDLEVLVDNETAVTNLSNLAKSLGFASSSENRDGHTFAVTITKTADAADQTDEEAGKACPAPASSDETVVVIGSSTMGIGDEALGTSLMKSFIFSLSQQDKLPKTILFYNGGVRLTCEGSESLDDLAALADAGVEILSCGTCLNFYGLTDQLKIGEPTNMYAIVEKQMKAGILIRP